MGAVNNRMDKSQASFVIDFRRGWNFPEWYWTDLGPGGQFNHFSNAKWSRLPGITEQTLCFGDEKGHIHFRSSASVYYCAINTFLFQESTSRRCGFLFGEMIKTELCCLQVYRFCFYRSSTSVFTEMYKKVFEMCWPLLLCTDEYFN